MGDGQGPSVRDDASLLREQLERAEKSAKEREVLADSLAKRGIP